MTKERGESSITGDNGEELQTDREVKRVCVSGFLTQDHEERSGGGGTATYGISS